MFTFQYQARDNKGKISTGSIEALNEENAVSVLGSKGLIILGLQQTSKKRKVSVNTKVSDTDLVLFTRQLATMIDAGLPLVTCLNGLYEQASPKKQKGLRNVVGDVVGKVQQGDGFHESISKHPKVFDRLYLSMVKAGETGGMLAEILDRLAGFLEASSRLKKKVKSALTYPAVVICIAMGITIFLIVKVVPVFAGIFSDFGANLPAPTQVLIDLSDFIRGQWYYLIGGLMAVFFGIRAFIRTKYGHDLWDRMKLKLPVFGNLIHKICMSRFARTFAQLIRSGVPILEVLDIVGETADNSVVEKAIRTVKSDIEKGEQLSNSLNKQPVFPPMMLRMVSAGEVTGQIDGMLEKMADFWDEEIEATLSALTSLIEPMLIVFLGVVVGGIVIAMFLPIFKLNEIVSK